MSNTNDIDYIINASFAIIAPFWPLQNLMAVNPLQGLEHCSIEQALNSARLYFERDTIPEQMIAINNATIKWLQVYCDEGQAMITMPLRKYGLYYALQRLLPYDTAVHRNCRDNLDFLAKLAASPAEAIMQCLTHLGVAPEDYQQFITLLLTTLSGWSSYIKYKTQWSYDSATSVAPVTQMEYVAFRILLTTLIWPEARQLLAWHHQYCRQESYDLIADITVAEQAYRAPLLCQLAQQELPPSLAADAQIVFCMDVRSEPMRRHIEALGNYQTLGCAGFFGIPAQITNQITGSSYSSCPVLLKPACEVVEAPTNLEDYLRANQGYEIFKVLKLFYHSLKYNFSTPFALVEALGAFCGIWMGLKTMAPNLAKKVSARCASLLRTPKFVEPKLDSIAVDDQCAYAESLLRAMGLVDNFAAVVIFCGHGSVTNNNAYASALDCGACGGRHGASNAKIIAAIMNNPVVKDYLAERGICIPAHTIFLAAGHNTTTNEVMLYGDQNIPGIAQLQHDLAQAAVLTNSKRFNNSGVQQDCNDKVDCLAHDWAQVRPEWGLARNAAFIVAPRAISASLDLGGRCFLHSYDYRHDIDGEALTGILTAPVVLAEWINMQYLFSTLNNVAYGGGSKITQNITGKIGIMQGNASDLMTGLPLQSVYSSDTKAYHELQRLMVVVMAMRETVDRIIAQHEILQHLCRGAWIQFVIMEPQEHKIYLLDTSLHWQALGDVH